MVATWRAGMDPAEIVAMCAAVAWRELGPPEGWPPHLLEQEEATHDDIRAFVSSAPTEDRWYFRLFGPSRADEASAREDLRRALWGLHGWVVVDQLDRARAAGEALQQPVATDAQDAASAAEEDAQELAEVLALLDREQVPREHQDGRPLTPVQRVAWLAEDIAGRKALARLVGNPEGWPVMLSRQGDTGAVLARLGQDQVVRPTLGRALRALARARDEQDRS